MRGEALRFISGARRAKALVVRGGLARTFGGLAGFLALTFFCCGVYVLEDTFANPLTAQAAALIFGAFITALAVTLFYFLLRPRKRNGLARRTRKHDAALVEDQSPVTEGPSAIPGTAPCEDLAYKRVYADRAPIVR